MTTLRDGTVVDESIDALHYTEPWDCPSVFGFPRVVESITIHHWGDLNQNFDQVVAYLAADNPRMSSAHAVIMAGRATSIVNPARASWAAGNAYGNARSVHLECRPEATDADYVTVAAYIAMLREELGDLPLRPHNSWVSTTCPGVWDLERLDAMARSVPKPTPIPSEPQRGDTEIHWVVDPGDTLAKIAAYYGIPKDAQRIADYNGIKDVNQINVGQKIFIPGPLVWNIEEPDTLISVARYYGVDADWLARRNGLSNHWAEIYIGDRLIIKDA